MIEVTYEMVDAAMRYFNNPENAKQNDRDWIAGVIKIIIELHEANKPKPEPVGYVKTVGGYPDESEHRAEWVVKYKELKDGQPLYTTPPTREPLSEDEVWRIYDEGDNVSSALEFARAVEKAHGIGV